MLFLAYISNVVTRWLDTPKTSDVEYFNVCQVESSVYTYLVCIHIRKMNFDGSERRGVVGKAISQYIFLLFEF